MPERMSWERAGLASAAVLVCLVACDSVLGIEEPRDRALEGGEAGASSPAGAPGASGSETVSPAGGTAGEAGTTSTDGGGAGEGGAAGAAGDGGAAGTGGTPECEPDERRCGGEAEKQPQRCDADGRWAPNLLENGGEACPDLCDAGACVECLADAAPRCASCEAGDASCDPRERQTCVGGSWTKDTLCPHYCEAGACQIPASCNGAGMRGVCKGESCCRSLFVPGGEFKRDYDGSENFSDAGYAAKLSSFYLDKYEVTVGRMRAFVDAFELINLQEGQGKAEHIEGDLGWNGGLSLPDDKAALLATFACAGGTWSDETGVNDSRPINCVPFDVAYAFCIWDGGRLPTSAEWNYAAAGGAEQRVYAWGSDGLDATRAAYGASGGIPPEAGSAPAGAGRWGQLDLLGSVAEWNLDFFAEQYSPTCDDCLNTTASPARVLRGGDFMTTEEVLFVAYASMAPPSEVLPQIGFRCARDSQMIAK